MGLVMKKSRYPFFEGKTSFFPFICRFITMKTVVIAMTRDFIAMKTVVIVYEFGTSRQRRRSSWESSAHLMVERPEKTFGVNGSGPVLVCKYSILREFRFNILFYYL